MAERRDTPRRRSRRNQSARKGWHGKADRDFLVGVLMDVLVIVTVGLILPGFARAFITLAV